MVVAEDVVSYFRSLKSYERIWIMCRLQHSCLPFELRFLGTCLEELGRKDFHELRAAENEANTPADNTWSELRKISSKHVQKKIILYLSLLHSNNYSCSNLLFKILCDSEEVNTFLKHETVDENENGFEQLLMIYTLAVNHPAFSCEQKQVLHNIFTVIQLEETKRMNLKHSAAQTNSEIAENAPYNPSVQVQDCQHQISTSPDNTFPPQQLPNPSHLPTVPPPYTHDLSIPMPEQISIGLPAPNFVRFPFSPAWNAAPIPIVFTTTEQTNTTHSTFMSRSSSPSISNSPSRSSSPAKTRPLSAPFIRSPQLAGHLPHQPASLPLPQTTIDPFGEMINKDTSPLPINPVPHFASEQLLRLTDEELAAIGMTEESIQQLRCMATDKRLSSDDLTSAPSTNKITCSTESETEAIKEFIGKSIPTSGLVYSAAMAGNVDPTVAACSILHPCAFCLCGPNHGQPINGFITPTTADVSPCLEHDMNMLRLETDAPSRNSNESNSDTTSSDQSSPPNTPMLTQNIFNKRCNKSNGNNEWSNNNVNNNHSSNINDERSNAGDSSSEEKSSAPQTLYQGRGRVINNRGRSKNQNTYSRGRGNNRRRNESMNGNSEDSRKPNFSVGNTEATTFQYTNPVTATVTNATYIQPPHYLRYNPSFPANSYLRGPSHHPFSSGELLYHHYPPPHAIFPGAIPYTPVVLPKLSCYNCGSQSHFANDCSETTLEDTTKPSQYRLDFAPPVEGTEK